MPPGVLGCGIRNRAQGIGNPTNDWSPESKFYWQILEFSTWNPKSTVRGIQNPRMSLIRLHGVICKTSLKFYVYYTEYARLFKTVCTNKMHFRTHVKITRWWESEATN